jgi:hypothetical protein
VRKNLGSLFTSLKQKKNQYPLEISKRMINSSNYLNNVKIVDKRWCKTFVLQWVPDIEISVICGRSCGWMSLFDILQKKKKHTDTYSFKTMSLRTIYITSENVSPVSHPSIYLLNILLLYNTQSMDRYMDVTAVNGLQLVIEY